MPRTRRLAAAVAVCPLGCCAAAAPAVAADVRIDLPRVPIDAESTTFTVSGTAPVAAPGQQVADLVVAPRAGGSCAPPGPVLALSSLPVFVPSVGQVLTPVASQAVTGAFSERFEFVGATGRGVLCAWLLTQDTPAGLVLGASAAAPIRLIFRLPASVNGFPFIQQVPRQRGATLTAFLGRDHRFSRFQATCESRGPHDGQRFTLFRRALPDPTTGALTATGIAVADNSRNYDAPIPAPYRGRARLTVSGRIVPTTQGIRIRGTVTLGGPGLTCPTATLRP